MTTEKISLDFYNNSVKTVFAKQSDAESRNIEITCTDHGKKVNLDNVTMSAFVRMKKADGKFVFYDAIILNDGVIFITLKQQMLAVAGKQIADVMILSTTDITSDDLSSLEEINDLANASVISVMPFYLVVIEGANVSGIESSNELDALVKATSDMLILEKSVREAELKRQDDITGEAFRIKNENARIEAELKRQDGVTGETFRIANENDRIEAESDRQTGEFGESYRQSNEEDRVNAESERDTIFLEKIEACEKATEDANKAAEYCNSIVDQTGVVLKQDIVNNLETTEEGKVLDATVGKELNGLIVSLQETINNLPKIYYGTTEPTSNIGKDGDIYMMIIEEVV